MKYEKMLYKLKKELDAQRYEHTLGVARTAKEMAKHFGEDEGKAELAGLLHDCAKCIPNSDKISICKKKQLDVTEFELEHPVLLHAKLGAFVAKNEYGITDTSILDSIRWHTTGKPGMTLLEKIVFISDYIEPNRTKQPHLAEIRKTAFTDIDLCLYMILKDTVEYLSENPKSMDTMTTSAYEYYKNVIESRR